MQVNGVIKAKAGNGKGFMLEGQEGWFNAVDANLLAKFNKGDKVVIVYEAKGMTKNVTMIATDGPIETKTEEFKCTECGAKLKDGKYTKCYMCSKKSYGQKKSNTSAKSDYNSPERTAQIQRGNALNASAAVLAGRQEDPETLAEMSLVIADRFLEWLRSE